MMNNLLVELDSELQQFHGRDSSTEVGQSEVTNVSSSWHDAIKDINNSTPALPRTNYPNLAQPRNSVIEIAGSPEEQQSLTRSESYINSHYFKTDMTQLCNQGWNLSQGWQSRPKAVQINYGMVENNIKKWAKRMEDKRSYSCPKGRGKLLNEIKRPPSGSAQCIGKPYSTPGPKYVLMPSQLDHRTKKQIAPNHSTMTNVKDIRFGPSTSQRFPEIKTYDSLSARPQTGRTGSANNNNNNVNNISGSGGLSHVGSSSARPHTSPTRPQYGPQSTFSSGRLSFGSIFYDTDHSPSPGPKYDVSGSFSNQSNVMPTPALSFAPTIVYQREQKHYKSREGFRPITS